MMLAVECPVKSCGESILLGCNAYRTSETTDQDRTVWNVYAQCPECGVPVCVWVDEGQYRAVKWVLRHSSEIRRVTTDRMFEEIVAHMDGDV